MPAIINFVNISIAVAGAPADKTSFGTLLGVFDHSATVDRINGPYFSIGEVVAAGFTSVSEPEVYAWANTVFSQDDGVDSLLIGRQDALDANWTATMNAIELESETSELPWYITNIESRADADILEVAAWTESREKIFIAQTSSSDLIDGVTPNIGSDLADFLYTRTALWYHATDSGTDGYLDGAISSSGGGMNLDTAGGVGIWAYRQLEGVTYDAITNTQANNVYAQNANMYGRNLGLSFTSKGTMAAGSPRFIDITTSIDWLNARLQEAVLTLFVQETKIPYTDGGINQLASVIRAVFSQGVTYGHFSGDTPPTVTFLPVAQISAADKQARIAKGKATAVFAGAIQSLELDISLSF